jgi:hypothetical protein
MSALIGSVAVVAVVAIAAIAAVVFRKTRRPRHGAASRVEPPPGDDTAATGYVPGVWMLGGADSAAPGHPAHGSHHGVDPGGSHAAAAGSGHSGGGDSGGGAH